MISPSQIITIDSLYLFEDIAMSVFRFQAEHSPIFKSYLQLLNSKPEAINNIFQIPFLPIELFKTNEIITGGVKERNPEVFTSSGTTGQSVSRHFVKDISIYEASFRKSFELFYGDISEYCILALLPSYLERKGSSLVYMMDTLIKDSQHPQSGFYLDDYERLSSGLKQLKNKKQKTILLGVTYALLDFAEAYPLDFPELIVMETGGMKGKREELIRSDVHDLLKKSFGVSHIHSEYGMTELLSQAYSKGNGIFHCPPWMKVIIRDQHDLFSEALPGQTGVISIIDLANIYSCSFITTQDVGRLYEDGSFEVLGRMDFSDVRGCNLMVE